MRPLDHVGGEPREITLFERWMGMTPEEWDALGDVEDAADEQPALF